MYENAVAPLEKQGNEQESRRPRLYYCKSKRYANYMLAHGSRMVQIQNDKFRPGFLVFVFMWDDVCDQNARNWDNGERETYIG